VDGGLPDLDGGLPGMCTTSADCAVGECCYMGLNICGPDLMVPGLCM
jgi:hypothetical protein